MQDEVVFERSFRSLSTSKSGLVWVILKVSTSGSAHFRNAAFPYPLSDRNKVLGLNLVAIYRDVQEEETVFTLKAKSDVTDFYRQMNRQLSLIDQIFILFSSLAKPSVQ